ncbi:hypothetical protein [Streptomyces sp. OK228]|uniref:hypothetical protein n=1 Tax=Streptomyces sp. OK228 TaxID=1882786 RepID=UPI000BCD9B68|nr:hypothetical protein [Streptomyces sp. OK228]SOE25664.1 hypothetical protein SAMN05442782_2407 [Streptomyces sp. OK228]
MTVHPLVIAELKIRAAQLDLKSISLDVRYPGESAASASRRYREKGRVDELAASFRRLVELAEADG